MALRRLPFICRRAIIGTVIGLTAAIFALPVPAQAQHRARLSKGLAREVQQTPDVVVSVIAEGPQSEMDRLARTYGLQIVSRMDSGAKLTGTAAQFDRAASDPGVVSLAEDERVAGAMAVTTASTGASQLWKGKDGAYAGITGRGVNVVVIDSGIAQNPDLDNRVMTWVDFVDPTSTVRVDTYGHGTHVGGIIAGSGAGSRGATGGAYIGMAPGANLISERVLGTDGSGYVSDVLLAIDWAIRNKNKFNIQVINLSLGHPATTAPGDDPLAKAVERAVANGIVLVCSAGNLGKTDDGTPIVGGIVSPGDTPGALTVGALNTHGTVARSDDTIATYSSRGPVGDPDQPSSWQLKPDLVAPGNAIVSDGNPGSYLWDNYPTQRVIGANGGNYMMLSGSSMAAAVVSGAVAQLLQANPKLSPAEVKFALQFTAQHVDGFGLIEQGAGSLNVPLAVGLATSRSFAAAPTSVVIGGETVNEGQISFANTAPRKRSSRHNHLGQRTGEGEHHHLG